MNKKGGIDDIEWLCRGMNKVHADASRSHIVHPRGITKRTVQRPWRHIGTLQHGPASVITVLTSHVQEVHLTSLG